MPPIWAESSADQRQPSRLGLTSLRIMNRMTEAVIERSTARPAMDAFLLLNQIAESSCEMRNLFLDRSLLVPNMADDLSASLTSFYSIKKLDNFWNERIGQ